MTARLPTVKLTDAEWTALGTAAVRLLGEDSVKSVLVAALGSEKAEKLIAERKGEALTKRENWQIIRELYKIVPGANEDQKTAWLADNARPCFESDERFAEVVAFCRNRVELFREAGGSLDVYAEPFYNSTLPVLGKDFIPMYGRVNEWCASGREELAQDVELCGKLGVSYTIEMAGWGSGQTAYDSGENMERVLSEYKWLLAECRARNLWLLTSITNWNITITKYENHGRPFASIVPYAKRMAEVIFAEGPDNQIIQPVAETGDDESARDFERWCGAKFAGWNLCYNGGANPSKPAYGWPLFAQHPQSTGANVKRGCIAVSDCGTTIKQLAADGSLDGPGDRAKVAAWVKHCKACGAIVGAYYAFRRKAHDAEAIKACAAVHASANAGGTVNASGAIAPSQVEWLGKSYSNANTTVTLTDVSMNGKHLNFKASSIPWPATGEKKCKAVGFLIRKLGDKYVGGKVEWCVVERGWFDIFTNTGNYNGSTVPSNGETCWAGLGHPLDGSECSNLVPFTWRTP